MQKQKVLIDKSYFFYKCLTIGKTQNPEFTYRTNGKWIAKINQEYFDFLKRICRTPNFDQEFVQNNYYHWHSLIKPREKDILKKILSGYNCREDWIDQIIDDSPIYQIKFGSGESRLVLIQEKIENKIIIKPLFLDINHLVYRDEKYEQIYNSCLICHGKKCSMK